MLESSSLHILLASSSPRRRALLDQLDLPYRVHTPTAVDEAALLDRLLPRGKFPSLAGVREAACELARAKADDVLASLRAATAARVPDATDAAERFVVVAADTMVVCEGEVLNKPADADEARRMLGQLMGRTHHVISGLAVHPFDAAVRDGARTRCESAVTEVTFRARDDALIETYVATGDSLDKAGAYGIQGLGAALVERVDGCYFNVVGLPIALLTRMLGEIGCPVDGFWRQRLR